MLNRYNCVDALCRAGIAHVDAIALRRISMTLHGWHELECGNSDDYKSYCLVRGDYAQPEGPARPFVELGKSRGKPKKIFIHNDNGRPYMETHYHDRNAAEYYRVDDRERGALKRLAAIMARYPDYQVYVQGDPRGASLYILRPGDVRDGASIDSCYSNGIAVCK